MFHSIFANDRSAREAAVLAATQEPIAASALTAVSGAPAWATIPSWDVTGTADHAIPPAEQEFMAARAHSKVTQDRRIAPVDAVPPRDRRQRDRAGRPRHLLTAAANAGNAG